MAALSTLIAACGRQDASPSAVPADTQVMPPLGEAREPVLPRPIESMLANGLRIIVLPRPGSSLVVAEFAVLSGGEVDPPGRAGLANFLAGLLPRGTAGPGPPRNAMDLAAVAEALGGTLHARAGWDASRISLTVSTPKLAAALDLLADTVRHPAFVPAEVERLRTRTLDALRLSARDPGELAPRVAARLVHGLGPYGHPLDGTERSIARVTVADLRALHRRHYRPDNAALVLAGDLDAETGAALAAHIFGDWAAPAESPGEHAEATREPGSTDSGTRKASDTAAVLPSDKASATVLVIDHPDAAQAAVIAAVPLPARADPDYPRGLVANAVLGGGYSSRLNREIRIKRGLSYGAATDHSIERGGGALYASALTRNDAAAEVVGLMRAEFARLREAPVPVEELEARKASLTGRHDRALETAGGIAGLLVSELSKGVPVSELGRVRSSVASIGSDQLHAWARTHLDEGQQRFVIVGDARQFSAALARAGFTVERIAVDALDLDAGNLGRSDSGR